MRSTNMLDEMSVVGLVIRTVAILLILTIARFFYRLYEVRTLFREAARKHGVVSILMIPRGALFNVHPPVHDDNCG